MSWDDTYLYGGIDDCVADGEHCQDIDDDGYCNLCGYGPVDED